MPADDHARRAAETHRRRAVRSLCAACASLLLTMRIFSTGPAGHLRQTYAIVRTMPALRQPFDDREWLLDGTVLTLPLPSGPATSRTPAASAFNPN